MNPQSPTAGDPSPSDPPPPTADCPLPSDAAPPRGTWARVRFLWHAHVIAPNREERLLVAVSFLVMFGIVRFITHSIRAHRLTFLFHNVQSNSGPHIHHLVIGICGLLIVGYISTAFHPSTRWLLRVLAIAFGISAALTLDEFAIWLNVQDVYWARQGKESIDAVMAFAAFVGICGAGRGFIRAMWHDFVAILRDARHPNRIIRR